MEIKKIYLIEEIDGEIHDICFTSKEAAVDYVRDIVKAEIDNIMNNEEIYMDMFGYQPDKIDEKKLFRDFMESFKIKEIEVKK